MNLSKAVLGMEFGSTRIKAVLLDEQRAVAATGGYTWENKLEDGVWTYDLADAVKGMQCCFAELKANFEKTHGQPLSTIGAIGISGMMHGYLAFDHEMCLVTPFRTWRNTMTSEAAAALGAALGVRIPQRWSVAHLYKDILEERDYVGDICRVTTLAGYMHYLLTGEWVVGLGEASGMLAIDPKMADYPAALLDKFQKLTQNTAFTKSLKEVFPRPLPAGEQAGCLTAEGARLLDPTGTLCAGVPFAPPEGDAQTGMIATNSVRLGTGNVSAGTSAFATIVVDHPFTAHNGIDNMATPAGLPVALVHANNCTSDINSWVKLFAEFAENLGVTVDIGDIYEMLFTKALEGDLDCGGLISYNYLSGESVAGVSKGVPMFLRRPDSTVTLANFMRTHLYSSLAILKIGLQVLRKENVAIQSLFAHGGLFKTPLVGQRILSAAAECSVVTAATAGEGGPYGMALLAAYLLDGTGERLEDYLDQQIFSNVELKEVTATAEEIEGFSRFTEEYQKMLDVEKLAVDLL